MRFELGSNKKLTAFNGSLIDATYNFNYLSTLVGFNPMFIRVGFFSVNIVDFH